MMQMGSQNTRDVSTTSTQRCPNAHDVWTSLGRPYNNVECSLGFCIVTCILTCFYEEFRIHEGLTLICTFVLPVNLFFSSGICRAVYKNTVKAYAGDKAGDTCIFPFDYKGLTYNSCVEDNTVRMLGILHGCSNTRSRALDGTVWFYNAVRCPIGVECTSLTRQEPR